MHSSSTSFSGDRIVTVSMFAPRIVTDSGTPAGFVIACAGATGDPFDVPTYQAGAEQWTSRIWTEFVGAPRLMMSRFPQLSPVRPQSVAIHSNSSSWT